MAEGSLSKSTTVLIVVPWEANSGGVSHVVRTLSANLAAKGTTVWTLLPGSRVLRKRGESGYGVPTLVGDLRPRPTPGAGVKEKLAFFAFFPITILQLSFFLKTQRVSAVNIHFPTRAYFYFAILRKLLRFRLVVSLHGSDLFPNGERRPTYHQDFIRLLAAADVVVSPSNGYAQEVTSILPEVGGRSVAVHNPINPLNFDVGSAQVETAVLGDPYVLCIAAQNRSKALDVLIRAFGELGQASRHHLRLCLVGNGPLTETLQALSRELHLDKQVVFLGARPRDEIPDLLSGCEFFVLPSRSEAFGIVLLEAMAAGKAVLATNVGGIPEVVVDGETGLLVAPDDHQALAEGMRKLHGDEALRTRMGEAGRARARLFSIATFTDRYYEILFTDTRRS